MQEEISNTDNCVTKYVVFKTKQRGIIYCSVVKILQVEKSTKYTLTDGRWRFLISAVSTLKTISPDWRAVTPSDKKREIGTE